VPGTSSERSRSDQARSDEPAAAGKVRQAVRITNIYATPWHLTNAPTNRDLPDYLRLWRFEPYYRLSADQLPQALCREELDPSTLTFQRWKRPGRVAGAQMWLFRLPSGQIVASLSLDIQGELIEMIDMLEDCYFGDVRTGNDTAEDHARTLATQLGAEVDDAQGFLPERHQIVFGHNPAPDDCEDVVQRLIYRSDLDYRKEFSVIRYPAELNRRPGWLSAVGPFVSVACGHPEFIENAVFLSAVQAVAAAAQLRAIRQAAHTDLRLFRDFEAASGTTQSRRRVLERIADQLGDLELELSYSVEASADFGLLLPSLRVESYHNALYESMDIVSRAERVDRTLERLGSAITAELTAIESIERRADDNRRMRYAVAVGFVSAVAIPASLILAYLGINASQVNSNLSMFNHRYLGMYLTIAVVILLGVLLSAGLYVRHRREARHLRSLDQRSRWTLAPDDPHP
jgi:hypothetical protein